VKEEVVAVLQEYIDQNKVEKEDIWAARSLDLTGREGLTPVMVAVWDTGVDPDVFPDRMFRNSREKMDGKDNDGNGHVDDVHGLAYDLHGRATTGPLYPMDEVERPVSKLQNHAKGLFDLRASVDSPEAQVLKKEMSSLSKEEVGSFLEDLGRYMLYSHGTHVAGIAVESNPAAQVLMCRLTADHKMIPEAPTMEDCERAARNFGDIIAYYKKNNVRVVNMSWVVALSSFEHELEVNNIGKDAEERKKMGREMFEVLKSALYEAFESAPEILFVGGAGNSDNDITFDEFFPPMFDLPNLLIAGAVDQAGEPTSFTSFGPTVNVYSNGFEVESYVPGGDRVKFSGTSMASPNVVNLAAKLIAVEPELTPREVVDLILKGADEIREGDQVLKIINPKNSAKLLAEHKSQRASM
jgi:subtilisin family serine protease